MAVDALTFLQETSHESIEQIDQDYIVPIHTEARDWFAQSFENVVLVEEGRSYEVT